MQHLLSQCSLFALLALLGFALPAILNACEKDEAVGVVFTAINASSGNGIRVFSRERDGRLTLVGAFPTSGTVTGRSLDLTSIPGISYQGSREDHGNRPLHNTDHKARNSGISSTFILKEVLP